jgi:hypothetical protein
MNKNIDMNRIYCPSDDVVAREIEGELIIVPLATGIGDMEDELYTMNATGRAIWDGLDGKRSVRALVEGLASDFGAPPAEIEQDVVGLLDELLKRRIIVEKGTTT